MASQRVVVAITSSGSFYIPEDCFSLSIECIGSAGYVSVSYPGTTTGRGGNGAAYSKTDPIAVTPGSKIFTNIGTNGGNTWVNVISNAAPANTNVGCLAVSGYVDPSDQVNQSIGHLKYSGGLGGLNTIDGTLFYNCCACSGQGYYFGGGGGGAGPNGNGGNGGDNVETSPGNGSGSGGGGANGGTNAVGITAGLSRFGTSLNGGGGSNGAFGTIDYIDSWKTIDGLSYGIAGGVGQSTYPNLNDTGIIPYLFYSQYNIPLQVSEASPYNGGAPSGLYGNIIGRGLIILSYVRRKPTNSVTVTRILVGQNTNPVSLQPASLVNSKKLGNFPPIIIPAGTTSITIEGLGSGSGGLYDSGADGGAWGGAGGSYANTTNTTIRPTGTFVSHFVSPRMSYLSRVEALANTRLQANSWATIGANTEPTSSTQQNFSISAKSGVGNTSIKTSIGQFTANGGNGGKGALAGADMYKGGGGGGAAWLGGAGGNGGNTFTTTNATGTGGGGGSAASNTTPGTAGSNAPSATVGGRGGNTIVSGVTVGISGAGGTSTARAGNGANGAGGGGSGSSGSGLTANAGFGGVFSVYTSDAMGTLATPVGPGGGGGGAYDSTTTTILGDGGNGGFGGGGGGGYGYDIYSFQQGGAGMLKITYTVDPAQADVAALSNPSSFGYIVD